MRTLQGRRWAQPVALYGRSEERTGRVAQCHGIRPYTDFTSLLDQERPDALTIASAHHLHEPLVEAALERGVHTLVEKPLALTPEGAVRLTNLAEERGCRLAVVYQKRYNASVRRAEEILRSETYGRPLHCVVITHKPRRPEYYSQRGRSERKVTGGGVLINQVIHELDLLCLFFGEVESASGLLETRYHQVDFEDFASLLIRFRSGVVAVFQASTLPFPHAPNEFAIHCEGAVLYLEDDRLQVQSGTQSPRRWRPPFYRQWKNRLGQVGTQRHVLDDFISSIQTGQVCRTDARETRGALGIVGEVYRRAGVLVEGPVAEVLQASPPAEASSSP